MPKNSNADRLVYLCCTTLCILKESNPQCTVVSCLKVQLSAQLNHTENMLNPNADLYGLWNNEHALFTALAIIMLLHSH